MAQVHHDISIEAPNERDKDLPAVSKVDDTILPQRLEIDKLSVPRAAWVYRKIGLYCFSLPSQPPWTVIKARPSFFTTQLYGSIVANLGFVRQFSDGGSPILGAQWVSAWGAAYATALFLAQIGFVFINDSFGRRIGLWSTWLLAVGSIFAETFVGTPAGWLGAKLLAGAGIGSMQATLPLFINELSPTQIRGMFNEAYTFWYVSGQLLASVALQRLNAQRPLDYKVAVLTQWGMIGGLAIIYAILPESPWWLVTKGKYEKASMTLHRLKGGIEGYNADFEVEVMKNTLDEQRRRASFTGAIPWREIFRGLNGKRLIIALWPKLSQQFVGLSVFNNYAAYFFQVAGNSDPFLVTVVLSCCQLMSMVVTMLVVDAWGRRPLAVYGYMITTAADFGMGGVGTQNVADNATLGGLLVFFACLATFTTTSSSAIGYAYLAEIPKQDFRAKSAGWGLAIPNLFNIIFYAVTPIMIRGQGSFSGWGAKTGFFFGCTGAIVSAIGWFIVPETARRTPAEIDELFEKRVNLRKFKGYLTDVQLDGHREA